MESISFFSQVAILCKIFEIKDELKNEMIKTILLFYCLLVTCSISSANDHVVIAKIISGKEASYLKNYYKKKYKLNSYFSEMKLVHVILWRTENNSGDILFTQWGSQCAVDSFTESNKDGESHSQINTLMDTPCIISQKKPKIEMLPEFKIMYDVTLIERKSYDGEYIKVKSTEKIKFNEETGGFCSDSFGNTEDQCPYSMMVDEYK